MCDARVSQDDMAEPQEFSEKDLAVASSTFVQPTFEAEGHAQVASSQIKVFNFLDPLEVCEPTIDEYIDFQRQLAQFTNKAQLRQRSKSTSLMIKRGKLDVERVTALTENLLGLHARELKKFRTIADSRWRRFNCLIRHTKHILKNFAKTAYTRKPASYNSKLWS